MDTQTENGRINSTQDQKNGDRRKETNTARAEVCETGIQERTTNSRDGTITKVVVVQQVHNACERRRQKGRRKGRGRESRRKPDRR